MVRSTSKFATQLLCALLVQQLSLISAKSLASVLKGLVGKRIVPCKEICSAAGHKYQGYSSAWRGTMAETTCKCSGEDLKVDCEISVQTYKFASCCIDGKGCHEDLEADPAEEAFEEAAAKKEADLENLDEEIDEEDVSEEGVPTCGKCPGAKFELTKQEIASTLTLHNKMRAAVGTPPLKWSCDLMCQVQKHADKCKFEHSASYDSPIQAGENLASGTDGEFAAWMWFSEYGKVPPTQHATSSSGASHFTAVVWKASKEIGCGVCQDKSVMGGGVFLCQYADSPPNWNNAFVENVPKFHGSTAQYQKAGLDEKKAKEVFAQISSWGLHIGDALTRFYGDETPAQVEQLHSLWARAPSWSAVATAGIAAACVSAAAVFGLAAVRRVGASPQSFRSFRLSGATAREDEELACSLAEQ